MSTTKNVKSFFITDPASITPSLVPDEKSTKLISVNIENLNTNIVFLETLLKDIGYMDLRRGN